MVERRLIIHDLEISYNGLFEATELYKIVDQWQREKAYTKHEIKAFEYVYEDGKQVEFLAEPYKKINDYAKYVIRITIMMDHVKDVIIEKDGRKVKLQKGHVEIIFDGFIEFDWEHRWEKRPLFYFLRTVFDQFIYKINTDKFESGLVEEVNQIHSICKSFLNLYRY